VHDGQAGHQVDHRPLPSVVPPVHSGQPARPLLDDRAGRRPAGSGRPPSCWVWAPRPSGPPSASSSPTWPQGTKTRSPNKRNMRLFLVVCIGEFLTLGFAVSLCCLMRINYQKL